MSLIVRVADRPNFVKTVHLEGRADQESSTALESELNRVLASNVQTLVLDLQKLDYISSAGLAQVFSARKKMLARGGNFALVNLQPQVQKVFDIVKAVVVNEVFQSVGELDRYLDLMQRRAKTDKS